MSMKNPDEQITLDDNMNRLLTKLEETDPADPEYNTLVEHLTALSDIKAKSPRDRFTRDQMLAVGANLLGVVLILNFEHAHTLSSKAMTMLFKSRT